jgi:hypothetical protein
MYILCTSPLEVYGIPKTQGGHQNSIQDRKHPCLGDPSDPSIGHTSCPWKLRAMGWNCDQEEVHNDSILECSRLHHL